MKLCSILSKHRKAISVILILFLICSICTLFNSSAITETNTVGEISKEQFNNSSFFGYTVTNTNNGVEFVPNDLDPQVWVLLAESPSFNQIVIGFTNELSTDSDIKVYYAVEGESFSEDNSSVGALLVDRKTAVINVKSGAFTTLRFDIDAPFSISYIKLNCLELSEITKQVSLTALILLSVAIILASLLAIFEKKIGYFSWLKHHLAKTILSLKEKANNRQYFNLAVRLALILIVSILALFYIYCISTTLFDTSVIAYIFILSVLATILFIIDFILNQNKDNLPCLALVLVIIIGLLLSFSLPKTAGISWDDQIHYGRVIDLKCFILLNERTAADDAIYSLLFKYGDDAVNQLLIMDEIYIASDREFTNLYSYIAYLPSAVGIFIGELLDADFIKTFFFAKVAQILTYAVVLYFALKNLKSGALILSSICFIPTALFLASSFSYDWWVTIFIAYGYSIFISELQSSKKKITLKSTALMLGAMIIGCAPKAVYFFLIAPFLFMNKDKFNSSREHRNYKLLVLGSMAVVLASFLIPFLLDTGTQTDYRGGAGVNSSEQLKYILTNPFSYAITLIKFLLEFISFESASNNTAYYAYLGNSMNICGTISIFIMLYCAFTDRINIGNNKTYLIAKTTSWTCVFVQLALVSTALYISFTPVGSQTINGCSYRYIFPILIPALYSISFSKSNKNKSEKLGIAFVFATLTFNALFSLFDVYIKNILVPV